MTLQQYIESISRIFPDKGQTEIALDINNALTDFAERSKCITGKWTFANNDSTITGKNEVDADLTITQPVEESGYFAVTIPANIVAFSDIRVFGADGAQIASDVFYETVENQLRVYNVTGTNASVYTTVASLELDVVLYPDALSALGDIPAIPDAYHRALESFVLAQYYRRYPIIAMGSQGGQYAANINIARELEREYDSYVIRAKKRYFLNHQMGQTVADGYNF